MSELLSLYAWTLLAGGVTAATLALIGSQLTSRGQSVQALVVSQGSSLGVVIGLALIHYLGVEGEPHEFSLSSLHSYAPLLGSLGAGALAALVCERAIRPHWPARNTYYIALFASLLSVTYLITALVPSLESHMAAQFFGDLAVIGETESRWMFGVSVALFAFLAIRWRTITEASFESATFGRLMHGKAKRRTNAAFVLTSLIAICLAIQFMGLLFTISALFLVPVTLGRATRALSTYTILTVAVAVVGTVGGFVLSLWHGRMPTVPAIALAFLVLGGSTAFVSSILPSRARPSART